MLAKTFELAQSSDSKRTMYLRVVLGALAIGALAKLFLRALGMDVLSHVVAVGEASLKQEVCWDRIAALAERNEVLLNCAEPETEQRHRKREAEQR